jgi:GntR family transcriptional repressor for pyruvate dehydrogenase complex
LFTVIQATPDRPFYLPIAKLQQLLTQMKIVVEDEKRFASLDLEFHVTIAAASENFLIFDLVSMIRGQLTKALSRVLLLPNARPLSVREHVAIFNAIRDRDPEAASEAMRNHLEAALNRYHSAFGSEQLVHPVSRPPQVPARRKRA